MFGNFRELDKMRLRIWGSGVRISSGAPLSTHLRTPSLTVLASHDGSFKHVLATYDPNLAVMHLDDIDKRAHIGLPKWHRPGGEMLLHQTTACSPIPGRKAAEEQLTTGDHPRRVAPANIRFTQNADICGALARVRFKPKADIAIQTSAVSSFLLAG